MIPLMLGLGGLIAKVAAAAVIPRVIKALSAMGGNTETFRANPSKPVPETVSAPVQLPEKVLYGRSPLTAHSYRYDTYGKRTKESGDLDSDFGFAGLFHHGPSGLDLAMYRTYDSSQGRWISRDPLGESAGYNLYAYCGNNPVRRTDPSGLSWAIDGQPYSTQMGFWAGLYNAEDNSINTLDFGGHGSPVYQGIDPNNKSGNLGGLKLEGDGTIRLLNPWTKDGKGGWVKNEIPGFIDLLKRKLKKGARVNFWGCHVGAKDGLAQRFGDIFPMAHIFASPDFVYPVYGSNRSHPISVRTSPNDYSNSLVLPWDYGNNWTEFVHGQP